VSPAPLALEPGEVVEVTAHASFRGATGASARAAFALGSSRVRRSAYERWLENANPAGFGDVPEDMILVLTDRRLLIGRPRFFGGRPERYIAQLPFDRLAGAAAIRHGVFWGAAFAFATGAIVEVEALRARSLRRLVVRLQERLGGDGDNVRT
jgi:hypothetical protein